MARTSQFVWALSLVVLGCAVGGDGTEDAGGGMDAEVALDAEAPIDAGSDAGVDVDGGTIEDDAGTTPTDGGGSGPIACTPATASMVCGARPCVDGYCCDQPCEGACRSCGLAGTEGACTLVGSGADPEAECADEGAASCGTTGVCDGAGACTRYGASTTCDDGMACTMGDVCDGSGTCRGDAPSDCAPAAGNECCIGSCDSGGGCRTAAGSCADVCGGSSLSVGRACEGCGPARAAGSCLGGAIHRCDATSHSACQQVDCGGVTYFCTNTGGSWSWRTSAVCDDGNACSFGDVCGGGACNGTAVSCVSTTCMTRTCNGTSACTQTPNVGIACDDASPCTHGDACNASGTCVPAGTVTCTGSACLDRTCNGTATCTETPRMGSCDDTNACTFGESCGMSGACGGGTTVTCPADTTCRVHACNGTATCAAMARNVGGMCDDGNAMTPVDRCQSDGTCLGLTCSPTLTPVFTDAFASPSSASWTSGVDAAITTSRWRAYTNTQHGVRIDSGRLEITNDRTGSPDHGHGYAYVRTDGMGSAYDNTAFSSTLADNAGHDVVWSLNLRRDDPESTAGGFSCSSTSSQNGVTLGVAYVLGSTTAAGLSASTSTCGASASANGYAVIFGGDGGRVNLIRFENGLRNGTRTVIARSAAFTRSHYLSVRVTYNADTGAWRLETRSDGGSTFADPATGTYGSTATGVDTTYATTPLDFAGPYFQSGCCCLCSSTYVARFDNVSVGVRCAGG